MSSQPENHRHTDTLSGIQSPGVHLTPQVGRVTPWTSHMFIAGPHRETKPFADHRPIQNSQFASRLPRLRTMGGSQLQHKCGRHFFHNIRRRHIAAFKKQIGTTTQLCDGNLCFCSQEPPEQGKKEPLVRWHL